MVGLRRPVVLTAVSGAESDLARQAQELRTALSLLAGVADRTAHAGLLSEANAVSQREAALTAALAEIEQRRELMQDIERQLRDAEERLAAEPARRVAEPPFPNDTVVEARLAGAGGPLLGSITGKSTD